MKLIVKLFLFDKKLITFCLAISDVVLVNIRGEIDSNLAEILKMSIDFIRQSLP